MLLIAGNGGRSTMNVRCGISKTKLKTGVTMTNEELLDHFAGLALQGIMANKHNPLYLSYTVWHLTAVSELAYDMAEEMLKQKAKSINRKAT